MTPNPIDHQSIPDGTKIIEGTKFIGDGKGGWQPVALVKPQHLLEDQTVRNIIGYADPLSKQISRFKQHTFDDIGAFEAILADEYDAKIGGKKGNKTLLTVDGLFKVQVAVADNIAFGPELQTAKLLFDECLINMKAVRDAAIARFDAHHVYTSIWEDLQALADGSTEDANDVASGAIPGSLFYTGDEGVTYDGTHLGLVANEAIAAGVTPLILNVRALVEIDDA